MSNPFGVLSTFTEPLMKLMEWIEKQKDLKEAQKRLGMAIKNEAIEYMAKYNKLGEVTDELIQWLDKLDNEQNRNIVNNIIVTSSDGLHSYGEFIFSYVKLSVAIKEFSTMETLMDKLRPSGFLYEFVCKIRDTVRDDNTLVVGSEYYRFVLSYEDKIFKKVKKKDVTKTIELSNKYIKIIKTKFKNALIIMSRRRQFKKKYIKRIFINNVIFLSDASKKLNVDIPEEEMMKYIPKKFLPMTLIFDEISKLEFQPKKSRKRYRGQKPKKT